MNDKLYTNLLWKNNEAFSDGYKILIHQGGTGSSKTYSNLQYVLNLAAQIPNEIFTVISESIPHLEKGSLRDSKVILRNQQLTPKFHETKRYFTFDNGSIVEYFSADRIDIATGPRRFFLYGNEINSFREDIWEEFARRSRFVIGDFNPVTEFWLENWLKYQQHYKIIKSNVHDNRFLPKTEKDKILLRASLDENFHRIHILCEYGSVENLVFKPENIILIDEFPRDVHYSFGLDFGFVAPSCLVKTGLVGTDLYIDEMFYLSGLDTLQLVSQVKKYADRIVYADKEDSRMINELDNAGINIIAAAKPGGSVVAGISFLQSLKIHITKRSVNTIKEFRNLTNQKNRLGQFTGDYVGDDHSVDATRYGVQGSRNIGNAGIKANVARYGNHK